jgi:hypothetical protein
MKKILIMISLCVTMIFLVSCTGPQTTLEKNRGRAFETVRYKQTVNPDAQSQEIVEGTPGLAGDAIITNYHNTFKKSKSEEVVNIIRLD